MKKEAVTYWQDGIPITVTDPNSPESRVRDIERLRKSPWSISYFDNPDEELQLIAVEQDWKVIKRIENPTPAVLEKVKSNGPEAEEYLKNLQLKQDPAITYKDSVVNWVVSRVNPEILKSFISILYGDDITKAFNEKKETSTLGNQIIRNMKGVE